MAKTLKELTEQLDQAVVTMARTQFQVAQMASGNTNPLPSDNDISVTVRLDDGTEVELRQLAREIAAHAPD